MGMELPAGKKALAEQESFAVMAGREIMWKEPRTSVKQFTFGERRALVKSNRENSKRRGSSPPRY